MKVIVTGAAGFVGSNLIKKLIEDESLEVVGIDSFTNYYDRDQKRRNLPPASTANFTLIERDLLEVDLVEMLSDANAVFHQAGQPGVRKSWGNDFPTYTRQNVEVTQALLEAARRSHSLNRFIYASSSSIYGNAASYPTSEKHVPAPISPYGVTKLAAEHLVSLYSSQFGVPGISLRYFTVYGPGQRPDMAFHKFLRAAAVGSPIPVYGSGEQIREFTYVEDIVRANIAAWKTDTPPGTVVNLSGGSSVSVNEVLQIMEEITGLEIRIDRLDAVAGDVYRTGGTTRLAMELLGWSPRTKLSDGLRQEYKWLQELGNV
jgi:UDP-glucuronate 4-epimerase